MLSKKKIQGKNSNEELGRYYLQMIKEICDNNKIPLFVAIFPWLKPLAEYKDYQLNEYETIFKVIKYLKINYVNLYEHLPEEGLYRLRERKEDEMHPSQEGHRIIVKVIYDHLLDSDFIKK